MRLDWLKDLFAPLENFFGTLEGALVPAPAVAEKLNAIDSWIWGLFLIFLLVGTGLYLAWRSRFIQIRRLGHAIALVRGRYDNPNDEGDISHFQALATALSATIGIGNIAGVATAIAGGGPGAVFWMWVTGLLGSGIKFTSCTLGMKYRVINEDGSASGGPMYYLEHGLGRRWPGAVMTIGWIIGSFFISSMLLAKMGDGLPLWMSVAFRLLVIGLLFLFFRKALLPLWRRITAPAARSLEPVWQALRLEKWMAVLFALFAAIASFGIGNMIQANSVALPLRDEFAIPVSLTGILLALLAGLVIIGGIKRIGSFTGRLTPIMTVVYVLGAVTILIKNAALLPDAFRLIFSHAFSPTAAAGGFAGAAVARTIQLGVARGIFSNESGLGSAPIAHAAARTREPVREGLVAMIGPFVDTLLICTMTALVIISTGAWQHLDPATGEQLTSTLLSKHAFELGLSGGGWIVTIGVLLFAFSTIIGWSYYGDRSVGYLFGQRGVRVYRWIYILLIPIGAAMKVEIMWTIADITNGLMAFPNLLAVIFLAPVAMAMTRDYFSREHKPYR